MGWCNQQRNIVCDWRTAPFLLSFSFFQILLKIDNDHWSNSFQRWCWCWKQSCLISTKDQIELWSWKQSHLRNSKGQPRQMQMKTIQTLLETFWQQSQLKQKTICRQTCPQHWCKSHKWTKRTATPEWSVCQIANTPGKDKNSCNRRKQRTMMLCVWCFTWQCNKGKLKFRPKQFKISKSCPSFSTQNDLQSSRQTTLTLKTLNLLHWAKEWEGQLDNENNFRNWLAATHTTTNAKTSIQCS